MLVFRQKPTLATLTEDRLAAVQDASNATRVGGPMLAAIQPKTAMVATATYELDTMTQEAPARSQVQARQIAR